jgi:choline dehydrogenase-like flavoprotein
MRFVDPSQIKDGYDAVVIGSGFGSIFFLKTFLERRKKARVLVLEWGPHHTHAWQIENNKNSDIDSDTAAINNSGKPWVFHVGLGGGTNCWWALSPRLHPTDFNLKTRYGVGEDWPLSYDDLLPYYREAEQVMLVAGPDDINQEWPDTPSYPMPAHNFTSADRLLKAAMPDKHFAMPCARLSKAHNGRPACCATAHCRLCPGDSKFSALNTMEAVLQDPRVDLCIGAKVDRLDVDGDVVRAVRFTSGGKDFIARGDLVVLGANAIYSPFILMKSGVGGHGLGRYLAEKLYAHVEVYTKDLNHFDGGTATTGINTSWLDGPHRAERGSVAVLIENRFAYGVRPEFGRWRNVVPLSLYVEDIPQERNGISIGDGDKPVIEPFQFSDYAHKSLDWAVANLPELLSALPVEAVHFREIMGSASHIQCTTRMGTSIENSVVDRDLLHHSVRNLMVVGNSVFPTTGSVNPSLTTAALSMRAAHRVTT